MARPLTRRKDDGTLYARPSNIEAEIDLALSQDEETLKRRLEISSGASLDYLSSETLLHLIRRSLTRNDRSVADLCLPVLLLRCENNLIGKVPDGQLPNAAVLRDDILGTFAVMIANDSADADLDELDYFECRFNSAFRAFRIDCVRAETRHLKRFVPTPERSEEEESDEYELDLRKIVDAFIPAAQEDAAFLKTVNAAIKALPEEERQALILCYVLGYKEESNDANEETAATLCDCTGRTIRNRLARAAQKLKTLKEDM
jgi:hypothetical protein